MTPTESAIARETGFTSMPAEGGRSKKTQVFIFPTEKIRYVLNTQGKYVPENESDLIMGGGDYQRFLESQYNSLPDRIRDHGEIKGYQPPNAKEMIQSLASVYTKRDLTPYYRYLPTSRKWERKRLFFENHFKTLSDSEKAAEIENIRSQVNDTDDYDSLKKLLEDYFMIRYSNRGRLMPNLIRDKIYRPLRNSIMDEKRAFVSDDDPLDKMNRIMEWREYLFDEEGYGPSPTDQPEREMFEEEPVIRSTTYMLNTQGRYVPEEESDIIVDESLWYEHQSKLLRILKGEEPGYEPTDENPGATDTLRLIASFYLEGFKGHFWDDIPEYRKQGKPRMLCQKHGVDPSGVENMEGFVDRYIESRKKDMTGKTEKGKRDCGAIFGFHKSLVSQQEKRKNRKCTEADLNKIKNDLVFTKMEEMRFSDKYEGFIPKDNE